MLEGLDKVNWAELSHAYGSAKNVPNIVRALASEDEGDREGAFYDLYGSLCHQGTVYSATAAAAPFLLEVLASPSCACRAELLRFLAAIAQGYGDEANVAGTKEAVEAGAPTFLALLDEEALGDGVRMAAAWALSGARGRVDAKEVARRAQVDSSDRVRAALWMALGHLGSAEAFPAACPDSEAVELAWALGFARAAGADTPKDARARLVALLGDARAARTLRRWLESVTDRSPFGGLSALVEADPGPMLPALMAVLERETDGSQALSLAKLLLRAALPALFDPYEEHADDAPPPERPVLDPEALSELQRAVLASIARSDAAWEYSNLLLYLRVSGIDVQGRSDLLEVLGIERPRCALIVTPASVPPAAAVAKRLERAAWLAVPFLFLDEAGEELDALIPEDAADFPPEVMRAARRISSVLYHRVVAPVKPGLNHFRFYPQLTQEALAEVCVQIGMTIVGPDLSDVGTEDDAPPEGDEDDDEDEFNVFEDEDEGEDEDDAGDEEAEDGPSEQCLPYAEVPEDARAMLEKMVSALDDAGWKEVRQSYHLAKDMGGAGVIVSPLAMARFFGAKANMECGFWCVAGEPRPLVYLRLLLGSKDLNKATVFRFIPSGRYDELLAHIVAASREVDLENFAEELLEPILPLGATILLESGGALLELRKG